MRRIVTPADSERGGIAVVVALLMVVLLGFAAISIDVARLYAERAQLQNGADAVALMLAEKCAKKDASECTEVWPRSSPLATTLASGNALDGQSNIRSISIKTADKKASVAVGAQEKGHSPNLVTNLFAQALGIPSTEVSASSSATWGTPSKGVMILPLAIAACKFKPLDPITGRGVVQELQLGKDGCSDEVPGGFGWVQDTIAGCNVTVAAGRSDDPTLWLPVEVSNGAVEPHECSDSDFSQMNDQTVLLPIYDVATGTGSGGKYYIKGFAAFHVTGYRFPQTSWSSSGLPNKSIKGYFVKFVSLSQAFELGNTTDYGTSVVRLTIGAP